MEQKRAQFVSCHSQIEAIYFAMAYELKNEEIELIWKFDSIQTNCDFWVRRIEKWFSLFANCAHSCIEKSLKSKAESCELFKSISLEKVIAKNQKPSSPIE